MRTLQSDQSLAEYFKEYRAFHDLLPHKSKSIAQVTKQTHTRYDVESEDKTVTYDESTVKIGPANLKFHRTLRVPDNAKNYLLPPVCIYSCLTED